MFQVVRGALKWNFCIPFFLFCFYAFPNRALAQKSSFEKLEFHYFGSESEVFLMSPLSHWEKQDRFKFQKVGSNHHYLSIRTPLLDQLSYKFLCDSQWKLDPFNGNVQNGNSVVELIHNNHRWLYDPAKPVEIETKGGSVDGHYVTLAYPKGKRLIA